MELLRERDTTVPLKPACEALGVPRATAYRCLRPSKPKRSSKRVGGEKARRKASPRRLNERERAQIIETMHSERFIDQTPRQVYAELLDEGEYLGSVRTFYRVLAELGETKERRNQRAPRSYAVPRLSASRPNEVWTWDITKLPMVTSKVFLNLYLVLDLLSRYPVAWMIAARENSSLSKQLFSEAIARYGIEPGELTVHNDRGAPMTAHGFTDLLENLGVDRSRSRPRVSNDNPYSESCFKTVKQQPDYPGRFVDLSHARRWCGEFFDWYANAHRHSGLAFFTPADVYFGRVDKLAAARQQVLDAAYTAHPERFVRGKPTVARPPQTVSINPLVADDGDAQIATPGARSDGPSLRAEDRTTSPVPASTSSRTKQPRAGAAQEALRT